MEKKQAETCQQSGWHTQQHFGKTVKLFFYLGQGQDWIGGGGWRQGLELPGSSQEKEESKLSGGTAFQPWHSERDESRGGWGWGTTESPREAVSRDDMMKSMGSIRSLPWEQRPF